MKLLKSTVTVGSATMISRVLGFIRDMVIARLFGASGNTDAFFLAFKIPNLMRRMFAEGSFSLAFVPVLSELRARGDQRELKEFVDHVAGTLAAILLVVTAIGVLAAPLVLAVFAPGWALEGSREFFLSADMLRVTFPYIFLISLTALAGGISNTFDRFLIPALTPILLNLSLISAALLLSVHLQTPIKALAWGVLIGGVLQLLVQIPALMQLGLLPRPRWGWRHSGVRRVMKLMIPTLVGSSVAQVNLLIDSAIATFLAAGSISWLYYSERLLEFPLGVFGIALATVILPTLSRKFAQQSGEGFSDTLDWALRIALLFTLPAATGLAVLARPILITLFQHGQFGAEDVVMASYSLMAYSFGLPAFIAVKVLAPGYFSRQDPKTPVRIALLAMGANVIMNFIFVGAMLYWGMIAPHAGLAIASTLSALMNAWMLYRGLRRCAAYTPGHEWPRVIFGVVVACVVMALTLGYFVPSMDIWLSLAPLTRVLDLFVYILAGGSVYILAAWLSGVRVHHFQRGAH